MEGFERNQLCELCENVKKIHKKCPNNMVECEIPAKCNELTRERVKIVYQDDECYFHHQ